MKGNYKMKRAAKSLGLSIALIGSLSGYAQEKPKPATDFTKRLNEAVYNELNFADSADFEDASKGFIATIDSGFIYNANGSRIINLHEYDFIKGKAPASVNPALWRQAKLNLYNGLFKVTDGIYQVRSLDAAVMSIIETNTGYIIVDPMTNSDAAKAGLNLVKKHVADKPVVAVITTHSHADHYGGVNGVVNAEDIRSGKVKYIVPKGFLHEVISENVLLGNAMVRRAGYQFGGSLPKNEFGQVDIGLGKALLGGGSSGLVVPNTEIEKTGEKIVIDGLEVVFQMTPGSEAPAEMHFYIPKYKAFCSAENAVHTLHNVLTPRGAKVRDAKAWASYIDEAIDLYGSNTEIVFGSHNWPVFGHDRGIAFLEKQRDLYKYINDQTIHLANKGLNMDEIAETIKLPEELGKEWFNRDFYGTVRHNSKAVYQYYLGWWDGNPANYNKLPEPESAKKYVEFMGGENNVLLNAQKSYQKGEYRWVAEVLKHVVFANPDNTKARNLQADAFEQIAYQSESGIWRDLYLTGAKELREGVKRPATPAKFGANLASLPSEAIFDYLSIAIDGTKAAGKEVSFRFIFPDEKTNTLVYLKNGVLHQKTNQPDFKADLTLTLLKSKFAELITSQERAPQILSSGEVKIEGNILKLRELASVIEPFDPYWNVITP